MTFDLSIAPHTFDEVKPWLSPEQGAMLYASKGCAACQMQGYTARTGVFEVLKITRGIRDLIADGKPVRAIRDAAASEKMLSFRQAAPLKSRRA